LKQNLLGLKRYKGLTLQKLCLLNCRLIAEGLVEPSPDNAAHKNLKEFGECLQDEKINK